MTRRFVYGAALVAFLAGICDSRVPIAQKLDSLTTPLTTACAMTLTSIIVPRWISWDSETVRLLFPTLPHPRHKDRG